MSEPIDEDALEASKFWKTIFEIEFEGSASTPEVRGVRSEGQHQTVHGHSVQPARGEALRFGFYEFDVVRGELACRRCDWHGPAIGNYDIYESFMAVDCPKCGVLVATISLPTEAEVQAAAEAGDPRALEDAAEIEAMKRLGAARFIDTVASSGLVAVAEHAHPSVSPLPDNAGDYGETVRSEIGISLTQTEPGGWTELGLCPGRFGCPYETAEEAIAAGAAENFCSSCRVIRFYRA